MSQAFIDAFGDFRNENDELKNQTKSLEKNTISWIIKQKPKIDSARRSSFFKLKQENNQGSHQKTSTETTDPIEQSNRPKRFETEKSVNLLSAVQKDSDESNKKNEKSCEKKSSSDEFDCDMEYKVNVFNNDGKPAKATEFFKSMKRYETTNQKTSTIFNFLDLIKNKSKEFEESKERVAVKHQWQSEKKIDEYIPEKSPKSNNNVQNKIYEIEK